MIRFLKQAKQTFTFSSSQDIYDVAVIGGGSGGLAFAFEAAKLGLKIAVFDYVTPSTLGSTWGLGGTCVNVGCIPKKLMHNSALIKEQIDGSNPFGWTSTNQHQVNWEILRENVQNHIKGLNYGYKGTLKSLGISYFNHLATFKDKNTLLHGSQQDFESNETLSELKFKYCVISVGGRPTKLQSIEKYAITSDDLFSLEKPPGKTLVVGGGYIALECAGLLKGLGYDVTLMTRGKYLRDFDQDIVNMLIEYYKKNLNIKIIPESLPYQSQKQDNQIFIKWKSTTTQDEGQDYFDTVLMAIGRQANTQFLNLEQIGVQVNPNNRKILQSKHVEIEKTQVDNIYAIGDVLNGIPELTPVAQKSGQLLARRIALIIKGQYNQNQYNKTLLDYTDYPTTVFTPLEYSFVGLSEEQAIKQFGSEQISVYHSKFIPLEEQFCDKLDENYELLQKKVYVKAIINKNNDGKIVGLHYLGPNAGEVMQGFAVALKLGLTIDDLQRTVGIHPTNAEEFVLLKTTKESEEDFEKHGC